ncbi:MAG: PPC domain-containing DNA-binding protein [Pseudonocardiaceae bacterium]
MRSHELTTGRTFGIVFDHGDDFFDTLTAFCTANNVRQGYIPMFIAAFAEAEIVGTCEKIADPGAPVWSKVHLTTVEALGCGTLGYDPETGRVLPHIHTSLGLKERSALAHTSHPLSARVQFLVEMLLVEITTPTMVRTREPALFDVPLLRFGS